MSSASTYTCCLYLVLMISFLTPSRTTAQNGRTYELLPAPDIWYNDVDGIRVGARVLGQVPGTFEDGPHRLDFGAWFSTWMPDLPVSYYLSFTEPIPSISGFNSEGNLRLVSSVRTGFSRHTVSFNKRWQQGFEELNYTEMSLAATGQKRFDMEYVPFPVMWQDEWLVLVGGRLVLQNENVVGRYLLQYSLSSNLLGNADGFLQSTVEVQQVATLGYGFELRGRAFLGMATERAAPEFLFSHSLRPAEAWVGGGLTRAKGTIPTPWMESGIFQISGGANLRGYTRQDIGVLGLGLPSLFTSMAAVNVEFDYPNPIDKAIKKIPVLGGLLKLRSYLFFDTGTSTGFTAVEEPRTLSDAGPGFMFSLNIPDNLGKPRGIMIRYDIPLWLSHPEGEDHFSYRSLVGIGAIFSL